MIFFGAKWLQELGKTETTTSLLLMLQDGMLTPTGQVLHDILTALVITLSGPTLKPPQIATGHELCLSEA